MGVFSLSCLLICVVSKAVCVFLSGMIDDTLLDMRGDMFVWLVVVVVVVVVVAAVVVAVVLLAVGIPISLSIWMRRAKRIEERV